MQNKQLQGKLLENISLAQYTTWRVGGCAKKVYRPASILDLSNFLVQIPEDHPILWLGLGSNSLIRDTGFNGNVIVTQGALSNLGLLDENTVRVEAGVSCAQMARFCARNQLSGGEFWAGIPGTMGGALFMNAGCFNGATWDNVVEVETINRFGEIKHYSKDHFNINYRSVKGLKPDEWFIGATFKLVSGEKDKSLQLIKELLSHRANTQPTSEYNCGSVFKNPDNDYAARLIESCGLKGAKIGGAVVSTKHANFIINEEGRASAANIEALIYYVKEIVKKETSVELNCEVRIIGDN